MSAKPWNAKLIIAVLALVFALAQIPPAVAQTVTGRFLGTIRDQQGAVVPNATVTAKNTGTGAERSAVTDASGGFTISSVPAGTYEITAKAAGFETSIRSGLELTVGAAERVDISLTVGVVEQQVQVTGEAPQVDTTTSTMAGLVADNVIRELPLNGRDWLQLAVLQPGVSSVPNTAASSNPRGLGLKMSISGGRPSQNVYRVDGLVVNDHTSNSPGSTLGGNLGVDNIREFSVLTNTYSAEYGRSSGGVINAITKSGTNSVHGTAFYFGRNSALDARNFFDLKTAANPHRLPPFRRHQFGGSVGGPIKKDKLFFFTNYEGLRQFLSLSLTPNTLSPNARNGIVCVAAGNNPCGSTTQITIDPRIKPFLPIYPEANVVTNLGDSATYAIGGGQLGTENFVTGKIDYQLSTSTSLTGSYTFDRANLSSPDPFAEKLQATRTKNQRVMLSMQHVFSPTVLDTVRVGLNRVVALAGVNLNPTIPQLSDLSLGSIPGKTFGLIVVAGLDRPGGMSATSSDNFWYTAPQINDDLSWVKGRHSVRIGFSTEAISDNVFSPSNPAGQWTFGSIRNFLTDVPQQFTSDFPGTDLYRGIRSKIFGTYIQDDFRIRPNLTLNLGARYEPATVIKEVNGKIAQLLHITDAQPTIGNPLYHNPTLKNVAPRVGFAWDPTGSGKTAIRSGFGVFDIPPLPNLFNLKFVRASPFFKGGNLNSPPPSSYPNGAFALLGPTSLQNMIVEQNPSPAYKLQWNFNIQREFGHGLSITAGYVGARGVHLSDTTDDTDEVPPSLVTKTADGRLLFPASRANGLSSAPAPVINPNFSQIRSLQWNGYSIYHGLQLNAAKKMSRGFTIQAAFAWSKSIDIGSVEYSTSELLNGMDNPYSFFPNLQRGLSDFDVPHRFSTNFLWDAPSPKIKMLLPRFLLGGWEVSGIFTAQSGTPFSMRIPLDRAGTGSSIAGSSTGAGQRPDFAPGPGCSTPNSATGGDPAHFINMNCFAFPAAGTLGNLGRNAMRGPDLQDLDFSLFKNHDLLGEKLKVQFRAEFFNVLNRANFGLQVFTPYNSSGQPVIANTALKSTVTSSRQIQLGLKFLW